MVELSPNKTHFYCEKCSVLFSKYIISYNYFLCNKNDLQHSESVMQVVLILKL